MSGRAQGLLCASAGAAIVTGFSLAPFVAAAAVPGPREQLATAAEKTLAQRSFTVETLLRGSPIFSIVYQAPDRAATNGSPSTIVIGRTLYQEADLPSGATKWTRLPLDAATNRLDGPAAAKAQLGYLLHPASVNEAPGGYQFEETVPYAEVQPGQRGQVRMQGTVAVGGGLVRDVTLTYFPRGVQGTTFTYSYTSINQSPLVVAPPKSKVLHNSSCGDFKPGPGVTCVS